MWPHVYHIVHRNTPSDFKAFFFSEKYPLEKCSVDYKRDNDVKSTTTASKISHRLII